MRVSLYVRLSLFQETNKLILCKFQHVQTYRQRTYKRNNEALSRDRSSRGKAISITNFYNVFINQQDAHIWYGHIPNAMYSL